MNRIRLIVKAKGAAEDHRTFDKDRISVGRLEDNDLVLADGLVSKRHAYLSIANGKVRLEDKQSTNGTWVNGKRITGKRFVEPGDEIRFGHTLVFVEEDKEHTEPLKDRTSSQVQVSDASYPSEEDFDLLPEQQAELFELKSLIHDRLLEVLNLKKMIIDGISEDELLRRTDVTVADIIDGLSSRLPHWVDRETLHKETLDEALGLGPLEDLIAEPAITEIMVNQCDQIFVEREGRLYRTKKRFLNDDHLMAVIERIVAPLGRRIDEASPMVDARLKDGSRVNAIIPPLSLTGPCITIRKFPETTYSPEELIQFGSLSENMLKFLRLSVLSRQNVIISGGTGSGKTTLLNILSSFIPNEERIVTIEDAAELRLGKEHVVTLESRPPNIEKKGQITIQDLVRNALRMRPDRIVVGECRGGEALDMLQAMNTGHDGSLTTAHANSPRDVLSRLETMVLMSGMDLPLDAIRRQIASAIHIIVQQNRFPDGSRKIVNITEITGMEENVITTQDIYIFHQTGYGEDGKVKGFYSATGTVPQFVDHLKIRGEKVPSEIFEPNPQRGKK